MLTANLDGRVDRAVSRHLLPEPKRVTALRGFLLAFTALFALVALVSSVGGDWVFAAFYGVLTAWTVVCVRRFLPKIPTRTSPGGPGKDGPRAG